MKQDFLWSFFFPKLGFGTKERNKQKQLGIWIRVHSPVAGERNGSGSEAAPALSVLEPCRTGFFPPLRTCSSLGHLPVPVESADVEYKYEYLLFSFPDGYWMLHKAVKASNLLFLLQQKSISMCGEIHCILLHVIYNTNQTFPGITCLSGECFTFIFRFISFKKK